MVSRLDTKIPADGGIELSAWVFLTEALGPRPVIHYGALVMPGPESTARAFFQSIRSLSSRAIDTTRYASLDKNRPDVRTRQLYFTRLGDTAAACGNARRQDHRTDVALAAHERALESKWLALILGGHLPPTSFQWRRLPPPAGSAESSGA